MTESASLSLVGQGSAGSNHRPAAKVASRVPAEIAEDAELQQAISIALPPNYTFELPKTIWRIRREGFTHVGLQMPEGLLVFAPAIANIITHFCPDAEVIILGDVTYGACCIDDLTAKAVGVDFLVHYGHSCLVPVNDQTDVRCMYVHVDIQLDARHLADTIRCNLDRQQKVALLGTIQFSSTLHRARDLLVEQGHFATPPVIPQSRPLSAGEVLGCTSPKLDGSAVDVAVFVADGRFHLESSLIANPTIPFFRYDPFTKRFFRESYAHAALHRNRQAAIEAARGAKTVGLILGTLGRQGSVGILEQLQRLLESKELPYFVLLMSEVLPDRLRHMHQHVDAFIQVACPRLSVDWGQFYSQPLLTPYEAFVAFGHEHYRTVYPMDFYAKDGGAWTNYGTGGPRMGSLARAVTDPKALIRERMAQRQQRQRERRVGAEAEDKKGQDIVIGYERDR
ncbi:unnamed protein product [Vitrella brassicaformis CCMP3155]|uniref:2-(3-amino-3-carboxypropyl)histidine synthase subunit 1 n=2 Tax=Vitrella brassicaformis TaxID=1169539 RepID=A0A0G4GCU6_VITBC|nr:unnamed protein product [Vitrella brassicaformis CCMP3155]|eukprot:CEM26969.1 unnamed protein product [Vitrella brassicaformis CCMP3155]